MTAKPLLREQAATRDGRMASDALLEVIQMLVRDVNALTSAAAALVIANAALEARLDAIAAVTAPTGGATVDSQSRTAINAIIAAAT